MWADFSKHSTYVRLDGGEIVGVRNRNSVFVRENKVNHSRNKSQEDGEMD